MTPPGERRVNMATYCLVPDDEEGLTPNQLSERHQAMRKATMLAYVESMTEERAEIVMAISPEVLMDNLELDREQATELKRTAGLFIRQRKAAREN